MARLDRAIAQSVVLLIDGPVEPSHDVCRRFGVLVSVTKIFDLLFRDETVILATNPRRPSMLVDYRNVPP
jgi:hypothetical protein